MQSACESAVSHAGQLFLTSARFISLSLSLLFCFLISFQTILSAGHLVRDAAICVCFFLFSFAVLVIAPSRSKRTVEWKDRFLNGPSVSCPPVHLSNKRGRTVPVVVSSRLVSGGAHSLFISPPSFSSCFFFFILFCFVFFPRSASRRPAAWILAAICGS